jgi:hypothetical protein
VYENICFCENLVAGKSQEEMREEDGRREEYTKEQERMRIII